MSIPRIYGKGYQYSNHKVLLSRLLEFLFYPFTLLIPRLSSDKQVRKILILEPFHLGDAVLLSVMLAPLKKRFPRAEIHMLIQPTCKDLYMHDPRVAKVHSFTFPWAKRQNKYNLLKWKWHETIKIIGTLKKEQYDIGIDTRGEIRNQILMLLINCKRRAGFTNYLCSNSVIRGLLLTDNSGDIPMQHRTDINLYLCNSIGCTFTKEPLIPALVWPKSYRKDNMYRVLVHTGGGSRFKLWENDRWAEVLYNISKEYKVHISVVGAPLERERLNDIHSLTSANIDFNITTLQELVDAIQQTDLLICLDSGPMNIATMLGKKVIAFFGPGVIPMYRPITEGSYIIHHQKDFECAPCSQRNCMHPDQNCMKAITVDEVVEKVREVIPDNYKNNSLIHKTPVKKCYVID